MAKHKTDYQLKDILKYNKHGSPGQQTRRMNALNRAIKHLQENRGYSQRFDVAKLCDKKTVCRLVHDWKEQGLAHSYIKNNMTHLRWLGGRFPDREAIPSNQDLGLKLRSSEDSYGIDKAERLDNDRLGELGEREQLATELRAAFGLRQEEALKFSHQYATNTPRPNEIRLKGGWCKGGRDRVLPVTSEYQRDLLNRVGRFQQEQGDRSMIPNHRTYKSYNRDYTEMRDKGIIPGHGLRHQWAQDRFKEVSGLDAPHAGGRPYSELNQDEQRRYEHAEKVVNHELGHGHGRRDITCTYIGQRS